MPGRIGVESAPNFWFIYFYFNFLGSTGLATPAVLGTEPAGVGSFVDPLLTNLIFEVQGPLNSGPSANAYFLAATSENIGLGSRGSGTGGVTNGNGRTDFSLGGTTSDLSDGLAHHRITSLDLIGTLNGFFGASFAGAGSTQWFGGLATHTPALWAARDGLPAAAPPTSRSALRSPPSSGASSTSCRAARATRPSRCSIRTLSSTSASPSTRARRRPACCKRR